MPLLNYVSAAEAVAAIHSNFRVFVQGAAATPHVLLRALGERASSLRDVELLHLHTDGPAEYADEKYRASFKVTSLFVGL